MKARKTFAILATLLLIGVAAEVRAELKMASVFTDHMVLQRDMPVSVWGWADPGETISVFLAEHSCKATADSNGKWSCTLPKMDAGGPFELRERIVLKFDHIDGGLVAKDGQWRGFAVAGADKQFVWAEATIEGDTVVVSSDEVKDPVAVRHGWSANPKCNLYNKAGLPASPFRTDSD
jgi:hypothetical protein